MTTIELFNQIFELCIIPLLGILTVYLTQFVKAKGAELAKNTDNALYQKYMLMLTNTVATVVTATNQTYVDALKSEGAFDKDAQKIAFEKTKTAVLKLLSDEAKTYLESATGDLNLLITQSIESAVKEQKNA